MPIYGTPNADEITSTGHEQIFALAGDDLITALGGDVVDAGSGNDQVQVSPALSDLSDVTVDGGAGNDVITKNFVGPGISSHVTAYGGAGDDVFHAVDVAFGGAGNDYFDTFLGKEFTGGAGADTFFAPNVAPKYPSGGTITDFSGHDQLVFGDTQAGNLSIHDTEAGLRVDAGFVAGFTLQGLHDPSALMVEQNGADVVVALAHHGHGDWFLS